MLVGDSLKGDNEEVTDGASPRLRRPAGDRVTTGGCHAGTQPDRGQSLESIPNSRSNHPRPKRRSSSHRQAELTLALQAKQKFAAAERRADGDVEALAAAAEAAFENIVKKYGDVAQGGRSGEPKISDTAKTELFELRNLRVGKTAPGIEGEDLEGTAFKLSDYRGKVVVIDFWGDW